MATNMATDSDQLAGLRSLALESSEKAKRMFEAGAGWRFGLAFGILLVLFGWGGDAWALAAASASLYSARLLLAMITILPLLAAAGGLSGRTRHSLFKFCFWMLAGGLTGLVASYIPYQGVSAIAGLIDPAARGVPVFPFTAAAEASVGVMIAFGVFAGVPAALLQIGLVQWAWDRSSRENQMTLASWALFLISAPLAFGLGVLYDSTVNEPLRAPLLLANRMVQAGLNLPENADLSKMDPHQAQNYMAAQQWRGRMSPRFIEYLSSIDPTDLNVYTVDLVFDNGLMIRCQVLVYSSFTGGCYDLQARYQDWMEQFLRTGTVQCTNCAVTVQSAALDWVTKHRQQLSGNWSISIQHNLAGIILVTARSASASVECRFVGGSPTVIQDCK